MPEFILSQQDIPILRFPFSSATTRIGRSTECDLILAGETISRVQLILYESQGSYLIKNVGKERCFLNDKVLRSAPLKAGDRIRLERWVLEFSTGVAPAWSYQDTQVSIAESSSPPVLNPSFSKGVYQADRVRFSIQELHQAPREFWLDQEITTIGSSSSCQLILNDPNCAAIHAKIILKRNELLLFDLSGGPGVRLNGVKIREAFLEEGSEIQIGQTRIQVEFQSSKKKIEPKIVESFGPIIGKSRGMQELYQLISQVAPTDATVCILGETGSGKELVARSLHDLSSRRLKPWVAINCGAISKELIESELFGHEKGAFTGAHQQRKGAFEQAHGGTLFLDEIGELPLAMQPTLLRILETGKLRRVGGTQEIPVDVRVICATHRDLLTQVANGNFREDLFFRLYVFPIFIPALRERVEDILPLADYFLKTMGTGKPLSLSAEARNDLQNQAWLGNVRELKNVIQRAIVLVKEGEIGLESISFPRLNTAKTSESVADPIQTGVKLEELEKRAILRQLNLQQGNRKATAKALGIAKSTLYEKLKIYGIQD